MVVHHRQLRIDPPRKRFRRDEVQKLADAGLLENARFELIDGDLIDKSGRRPAHASAMRALLEILAGAYGLGRVQTQLPMEVADASLRMDLTRKRDLYARAGVPEYWVVDANARRVIVFRQSVAGQYSESATYSDNETIPLPALPDASLNIGRIFA